MKYPSLKDEKIISLDIETYDPKLKTQGTGVYRDDGYILGVSICTLGGFNEYYNLGHDRIPQEEQNKNLAYLKENLAYDNPKIGANILYDLDWLTNSKRYNIKIGGKFHDVQIAEPLLDEYANSYSLDTLAYKYLGLHKEKNDCIAFCERNGLKGDFREHLAKMPYSIVSNYAKADSYLPIKIFEKQYQELRSQELLGVYNLEIGLIPLLLQMKRVGIRIDIKKVYENKRKLEAKMIDMQSEFYKKYGIVNYNSTQQLADIFKRHDIPYKTTEKGNPSIDQHQLKNLSEKYELCSDILALKKINRVINATFEGSLIEYCTVQDSRIHTTFAPLKQDSHGAVTARLVSFNPNLQQIPSKEENYTEEVSECFLPEEGCKLASLDASQIDYRLYAHYAVGNGSDKIRQSYNENPDMDYHKMIQDETGLPRKIAKNLNFGLMFGMGTKKCASMFGWDMEKAAEYVNTYHNRVPSLKETMYEIIRQAKNRKYIRTILGRKLRLTQEMEDNGEEYVMFNKQIQGSDADHMKKTMVDAYNKGLFQVLSPHLTIHDSLVVSYPETKEGKEALLELKNTMETSIKLRVPILSKLEVGPDWGHLKKVERGEL